MTKYLFKVFTGMIIFIFGIGICYHEIVKFDKSDELTSNVSYITKTFDYTVNDNEIIRITNDNTNNNMTLFIDNDLNNSVKIVIEYPSINEVEININERKIQDNKIVMVDLESELLDEANTFSNLYDFVVQCIEHKTIYNYRMFKYPKIKVYVNENYRERVEFVDSYGKSYNPIR